ncbi:four helix bundle protein [Virgibacillus sp. SK37]|uniref:four helix bundle protein n=1 Tax=Virgibacillus sp. SK37 TaxID=403957 RepID=UPI0004D1F2B8|nr:four helix bundle protein [Virgibacillus sp. SK37]AIF42151.1 30S ribosomal protein S23 [Virgibacillus sp. SK37]
MNEIVEQIQVDYRKLREHCNYSFIEVGDELKYLAEKGVIWILKDMEDITEFEEIIIDSYLDTYRANQIYDNLNDTFSLQTSFEPPAPSSQSSAPKVVSFQKTQNIKKKTLEVKDVQQFIGYKLAKNIEEKVIEICKSYPSYDANIVDQIERSAESIKRRIAMGEQMYIGEKFYHYSLSIGSAKETSTWLQVSLGQQYISQEQYDKLNNQVEQIVAILTRTLVNIKEREGKGMDLPSPYTPNVKNFKAYEQGLLLVEKIYEITKERAFWGDSDLVFNLRKYSTSTIANIAEAHQFYTPMTFRFFNDALKALNALDSLLDTTLSKGIISNESLEDIRQFRVSIRNILSKRMANISKKKAS